ncbi:MAG: SDR family NAD(P)-dependent oxidoreductase, partial [Candidatus Omnitrophota bacterium]
MRFQDKVVVVTGGAQGIGKEIALQFAKEKAKVVIFDLNDEQLAATANELKTYSEA